MITLSRLLVFVCFLGLTGPLLADLVVIRDGSRLTGTITKIYDGTLTLATSYAGTIEISMAEIARFETDDPRFLRLETGSIIRGTASSEEESEEIAIEGDAGTLTVPPTEVDELWGVDEPDPAIERQDRDWSYMAGLNVSGKSGNSEELSVGIVAQAVLEGPDDRLRLYTSIDRDESEGELTSEEYIGGVEFTSYVVGDFGWYTRLELERDEFEDIDLRSTAAAGLSYRFLNRNTHKLEGRAGAAYRYESYSTDADAEDFPGLDFALIHFVEINEFVDINTTLRYLPSVEDLGSYRVEQDSNATMPIGDGEYWLLQLGLRNEYNADPLPGNEELDTTWYTRLILSWE